MNVASIVIPCFNHAQYLPAAIQSALAQTLPCEVIVVDDGSTDDTFDVAVRYAADGAHIVMTPHGGVAAARNAGIETAACEYLMFLDADDIIEPTKVERQIAELEAHAEAGWCFCDVRITDEADRRVDQKASDRYGYGSMALNGNIAPLLQDRNFIPCMAPMIRRSVLGAIRFPDGKVEDWAFLRQLAAIADARYLPEVLATYKRRRAGRHNQ